MKAALTKSWLAPESISNVALMPFTQVVMVKSRWELSPEAAELRVRMGTEGRFGSELGRGAKGCEYPEVVAEVCDELDSSLLRGENLGTRVQGLLSRVQGRVADGDAAQVRREKRLGGQPHCERGKNGAGQQVHVCAATHSIAVVRRNALLAFVQGGRTIALLGLHRWACIAGPASLGLHRWACIAGP